MQKIITQISSPTDGSFGLTGLDFSRLQNVEIENVFKEFSIKYVYSGFEYYKTEHSEYKITAGQFLIAPAQSGKVYFENKNFSSGVCIYLDKKIISDALRLAGQNVLCSDPDKIADSFYSHIPFVEKLYHQKEKNFGEELFRVTKFLDSNSYSEASLNEEWFLTLTHEIVCDEISNFQAFNRLSSQRQSTKKEVLRRLLVAKDYMDCNFLKSSYIDEIAKVATLSKFHFFRSFKQAFGVTPYQYILNKKLHYAHYLIKNQDLSIGQVADAAGFSDQFTFCHTFKRKFGHPPSRLAKSRSANRSEILLTL